MALITNSKDVMQCMVEDTWESANLEQYDIQVTYIRVTGHSNEIPILSSNNCRASYCRIFLTLKFKRHGIC